MSPDASIHEEADSFLRSFEGTGAQKTYAYYLVDHLRWRDREGLATATVTLRHLQQYLGAVGAKVPSRTVSRGGCRPSVPTATRPWKWRPAA